MIYVVVYKGLEIELPEELRPMDDESHIERGEN